MNGFSDLATAANFSTLNFIQMSKMVALTKPSDCSRGELELTWGTVASLGRAWALFFKNYSDLQKIFVHATK